MLVVSHGGLIHALLGLIVETESKPMVNNCSITRIAIAPPIDKGERNASSKGIKGWVRRCRIRLIEANSTTHLGEHMSESAW